MKTRIECKYDEMVELSKLIPNPKNPTKHSEEQIKRIAKNIKALGMRKPIEISTLSNKIVCGHGRLAALMLLGAKEAPIVYQKFRDADEEYAYMISDNTLQGEFFEIDRGIVNCELENLGPDFDIELLGFKQFSLDPSDFDIEEKKENNFNEEKIEKPIKCPSCGYCFYKKGD